MVGLHAKRQICCQARITRPICLLPKQNKQSNIIYAYMWRRPATCPGTHSNGRGELLNPRYRCCRQCFVYPYAFALDWFQCDFAADTQMHGSLRRLFVVSLASLRNHFDDSLWSLWLHFEITWDHVTVIFL